MRRTPLQRTGFARKCSTGNTGPRHISEILGETLEHIERPVPRLVRVPAPSAPIFNPQPKQEYVRDESYRRFVASLPCFVCGRVGRSQAAHSNSATHGHGRSIKASDASLFPLCADGPEAIGCHTRHDQAKDGLTREQRRAREVEFIARMAAIPRP